MFEAEKEMEKKEKESSTPLASSPMHQTISPETYSLDLTKTALKQESQEDTPEK